MHINLKSVLRNSLKQYGNCSDKCSKLFLVVSESYAALFALHPELRHKDINISAVIVNCHCALPSRNDGETTILQLEAKNAGFILLKGFALYYFHSFYSLSSLAS